MDILIYTLATFLIVGLILWIYGGSEYEEEQIIEATYDEALAGVIDTLRYCDFKLKGKEANQGTISAESKWTIWSFGENIQIILSKKRRGIQVHFYSSCKLETQIIDWGKNRQNADQFFKALDIIL